MFLDIGVVEMKKQFFSRLLVSLSIFLFALFLVGCEVEPEKARKPSLDWSRGLPLGTDVLGTVGMAVDPNGESIHVVWPLWSESRGVGFHLDIDAPRATGKVVAQSTQMSFPLQSDTGGFGIHYARIDEAAQVEFEHEVIQLSGQARIPRLIAADNQLLHLFWTTRADRSEEWQLWYLQFDQQGDVQRDPIQLSLTTSGVSKYEVASDLNGGVVVVWEDTESGSIKFAHLSALGEVLVAPVSVVSTGTMPAIRVDSQKRVHLVWFEGIGELMYQVLDSAPKPKTGTLIAHIPLGTGPRVYGPALGIADQWGYVFWSVLKQSGLDAGSAKTQYIAFPVDSPEKVSSIFDIGVLPLEEQPYQPDEGDFTYTQLVPAAYIARSSDFIYDPFIAESQNNELAVSLAFYQQYRLDGHIQIVVLIMADGEYKGYTVATKTQAISSDVALSADVEGDLHLIWRDGVSGEDIYYTTTGADARAELDRLTLRDLLTLVTAGGMESFAGILLFPLAFPWIFPGLVVVIAWRLIRNDEDLSNKASQAILLLSILLYQGTKVLIFPTIVDYMPFSAWVDIPLSWQPSLQIAIPLLILGFAIGVAEWQRRRSNLLPSTLRYYFTVALLDMALTLAIYGVNFLGAY